MTYVLQHHHAILLISFFLLVGFTKSQAQIITGKIVRGEKPVVMAEVQSKKRLPNSLSDINGKFVVEAYPGDELRVFQEDTTWQVIATQNMVIDLNELTGQYATKSRKDTVSLAGYSSDWGNQVGSVTRLEKSAFNRGNIFDPYGYIESRVPGLTATRPGGDPLAKYDLQIRGLHTFSHLDYNFSSPFSFNSNSVYESAIDRGRPLLVVDGLPGASLLSVDPSSIASIRVLRDAASAAAYGLRGANGVVEIETARGAGRPFSINYETALVLDAPMNLPDVLGPEEYARRSNNDFGAETDWQDAITRNAWSQVHHLGIGGRHKDREYGFSLNFRDQQGIAEKSGFDQWNAQFRIGQDLWKDRISMGLNAGYSDRSYQDVDHLIFRQAAAYNPTAPIYDPNSSYGGFYQYPLFFYYNPVAILEQTTKEGRNKVATLGGNLSIRPINNLEVSSTYSFQRTDDLFGAVYPRDSYFLGAEAGGLTEKEERTLDNQFTNFQVDYHLAWQEHLLQLTGGYSYQRWDLSAEQLRASDFPDDAFSYDNTENAINRQLSSFRSRDQMSAFYGQLSYNWNATFFLKGSLRREGATRMGPERKWAWFPVLQGALSLHNTLNWGNRLHLRVGYGEAGQLPPKNFAAFKQIVEGERFYKDGIYIPTAVFFNVPNPAIGEERRREWNAGLDIGFLRNRLMLSVDWYNSKTNGIVDDVELPVPPNATSLFYDNFGALSNRGIEIALNAILIDNGKLDWKTNFQVFHNTTRLENINHPQAQADFDMMPVGRTGFPGRCCTLVQTLEEGQPIGTFTGPKYHSIDDEGEWVFQDEFGNITSDGYQNQELGNAQPDFQFGWQNDMKFGRFDLNFMLQGIIGHDMLNIHRNYYGSPSVISAYNVLESAFTGDIRRLKDSPQWSSYYLEDASFVRLRYLSLGYQFELPKSSSISNLRLYLTTENLFTITGYTGEDPSLRLENYGNPLVPGIEVPNGFGARGDYFMRRSLLLGVRVGM